MSSYHDSSSTGEREVAVLDDSTDDEAPFEVQTNMASLLQRSQAFRNVPSLPHRKPADMRRPLDEYSPLPPPPPPPRPAMRPLTPADLRGDSSSTGEREVVVLDDSKEPDTIEHAVKGLVSHGRFSEGADAALHKLSNEFVRGMLTEEFARECSKAGVPVHQGAEAEKAGHIRLLFDVFAMPRPLLAKYAPTWDLFRRTAEEEGLGSRIVIQEMVSSTKAAVLLPHCDPHAADEAKSGQSEAMVSLPCSKTGQQFVIGTSKKTVPTTEARFGSLGHGVKAKFQDIDPGQLEITRQPSDVLVVDDRVLGGHATCKGHPLLHTGNPAKQGSPTVRPQIHAHRTA